MVLMQQVLTASRRNVNPKATQGGDQVWRRLYQLHAKSMLTFAMRLTGGDEVRAEAIVQHTLRLAWRNADRLGAVGTLRPWLMTTARRLAAGDEAAVRDLLFAMEDAGRGDRRELVAALGR